jgi:2-oxoglutarate/2-oxoacid ferredoxin oxidoreductase subunit beta
MSHRGTAVLDIISPCVSFNDNDDSTKSYSWGKAHEEVISDFTFIPFREEISVDYAEGTSTVVRMHDGSFIRLRKLDNNYEPTDKYAALKLLEQAHEKQEFITGLIYLNEDRPGLPELERLPDTPLVHLDDAQIRPSRETLEKLMRGLM